MYPSPRIRVLLRPIFFFSDCKRVFDLLSVCLSIRLQLEGLLCYLLHSPLLTVPGHNFVSTEARRTPVLTPMISGHAASSCPVPSGRASSPSACRRRCLALQVSSPCPTESARQYRAASISAVIETYRRYTCRSSVDMPSARRLPTPPRGLASHQHSGKSCQCVRAAPCPSSPGFLSLLVTAAECFLSKGILEHR